MPFHIGSLGVGMSRRLVAAAAVSLVMAMPATAADLRQPAFKAAPAVAAYNWSGLYVGAHAGYGWADKFWQQTATNNPVLPLDRSINSASVDGFLGGAQLGVNWQTGAWVFGVEGDWSWTNADGCAGHAVFILYSACADVNWYATVTGRVGYAWDALLVYVKGGVAFADEDHVFRFMGVPDTDRPGGTRTGWTIGAGAEYGFAPNWSVKVEYAYMDFGSESLTFNYLPGGTAPGLVEQWDNDQDVHVVKFGINYRFGFGKAPVVANY